MKNVVKSFALVSLLGALAPAQALTVLGFTFSPVACSWANCSTNAVTGYFSFDDVNNDGNASLDELVQLYVRAAGVGEVTAPGAGLYGPQTVSLFSYTQGPGGGLSFSARDGYRTSTYTNSTSGYIRYDAPGGSLIVSWLPTTTLTVAPIPEPAQAWLWLAGGGMLAGWLRRGRRAKQEAPSAC